VPWIPLRSIQAASWKEMRFASLDASGYTDLVNPSRNKRMANLTIHVDSEVLKRARIRALEENTSVDAVLATHLEAYSRADDLLRERSEAVDRILALADSGAAGSGGRTWTRDELHDR
jgi:hypothetical protein